MRPPAKAHGKLSLDDAFSTLAIILSLLQRGHFEDYQCRALCLRRVAYSLKTLC